MPTNVSYPGVYVEEVPAGVRSITGVPTSIAGFVGCTATGPINDPVRIFSLIEFEQTFGGSESDDDLFEAVRLFFENGGSAAFVVRVAANGNPPTPTDLEGSQAEGTGLFALDKVDLFNILLVPGQSDPFLHAAMVRYAEHRRAFAILDLPISADTPAKAEAWLNDHELLRHSNTATYFPPLKVRDSIGGERLCANSAAIAGVFARTDIARGVWKAAAGTDAALRGVAGLAYLMNEEENEGLNRLGINALRVFDQGPILWGARTLAGADALASEWKYVPVRRLALLIEESIDRGIKWTVFEQNDESLWAKVRLQVGAYLHGLFREGAFQGRTPREAYFVRCDRETTSMADIERGVLNVLVGFAPVRPAEFVVLKFQAATAEQL